MAKQLRKQVYVFDIDGTIATVGPRIECITRDKPDWEEFFSRCGEDTPNEPVFDLCRVLLGIGEHRVILLTGRTENVRQVTEDWLEKHGIVGYERLIMRAAGDKRSDFVVKPELLENSGIVPDLIFEDRVQVVKAWRDRGYVCAQVAEGDY